MLIPFMLLEAQIFDKSKSFDVTKQKKMKNFTAKQEISFDSAVSWRHLLDMSVIKNSIELYKYNQNGLEILMEKYNFNYNSSNNIDTTYNKTETQYDEQNRVLSIIDFEGNNSNQFSPTRKYQYQYSETKPEIIELIYYADFETHELLLNSKQEYYMNGDLEDSIKFFDANDKYISKNIYYYGNWQAPDSIYYYTVDENSEHISAIDKWQYNSIGQQTEYINYGSTGIDLFPNIRIENIYNENNKIIKINNYNWNANQWELTSYTELLYQQNIITEISYYKEQLKGFIEISKIIIHLNENQDPDTVEYYNKENNQWVGFIKFTVEYDNQIHVDSVIAPNYYFSELCKVYVPLKFNTFFWANDQWEFTEEQQFYYNTFVPNSIKNIANEKLIIFPNPVSNFISINSPQNVKYEIYNINGQKLKTDSYNGSSINIEDLPTGAYILKINHLNYYTTNIFIKK